MLGNVLWTDGSSRWMTSCDGKPPVGVVKSWNDQEVNWSALGRGKGPVVGKGDGMVGEVGDAGPSLGKDGGSRSDIGGQSTCVFHSGALWGRVNGNCEARAMKSNARVKGSS